jgi:hypothetical protein
MNNYWIKLKQLVDYRFTNHNLGPLRLFSKVCAKHGEGEGNGISTPQLGRYGVVKLLGV